MVESFVAKKKTESLDGTLADVLFCNVGACLIHLRPLILMDNDIQSRTTRLTPSVSGNWARESCGRVSFNIPALFPSTLNADGTLKFLFHSLALSLSLSFSYRRFGLCRSQKGWHQAKTSEHRIHQSALKFREIALQLFDHVPRSVSSLIRSRHNMSAAWLVRLASVIGDPFGLIYTFYICIVDIFG